MALDEEMDDFPVLTAPRRSTCAFTNREVPARALEAILKDAATAPSWSNIRAFRLALTTGECVQRLREHYGRLFDEETEAHMCKVEDPTVEISVLDDDYLVRKRYPDELRLAQVEVTKLLYGTYGVERGDIEGRNRANRRNVVTFDTPIIGSVFVYEDMLPWSATDADLMLQTLFLSVKLRGVDSYPAGILATWHESVDAEFGIPGHYRFTTDSTFGYVDPEASIDAMKAPCPPIQLLDGK